MCVSLLLLISQPDQGAVQGVGANPAGLGAQRAGEDRGRP